MSGDRPESPHGIPARLLLSIGRAYLRACGRVVPARARARWREEWEGELWHELRRAERSKALFTIARRIAGAAGDAMDARRRSGERGSRPGAGIGSDLRFALRSLQGRPGYAAMVVLVLTLGIGTATTLFSVVDAVLLRPLRLPDSERLVEVRVQGVNPEHGWEWSTSRVRSEVLQQWQGGVPEVESFAAVNDSGPDSIFYLTGTEVPDRLRGAHVSADFFHLLGAEAALGRVFSSADGEGQLRRSVVIGHGLFRRHFGADPEILRKPILLNDEPYRVVGVLGADFQIDAPASRLMPGDRVELWIPLSAAERSELRRAQLGGADSYDTVLARLRPGVTAELAAVRMQAIRDAIVQPDPAARETVSLYTLRERMVADARAPLALVSAAVSLLLLLACVNAAGLQLVRGAERRHELSLRGVLGAGRLRLVRQLVLEGTCLALAGGLLGWVLARWAVGLVVSLAGASLPRLEDVVVDGRVLLFASVLAVVSGVASGLLPAWKAVSGDPARGLGSVGGRSGSDGLRRAQALLLGGQVALATLLLLGAGLLVRTTTALARVDPGIDPEGVLAMDLYRSSHEYDNAAVASYQAEVLEAVRRLPGVEAAAFTSSPPFRPGKDFYKRDWRFRLVSEDYFRVLEIPFLSGRGFDAGTRSDSEPVVVINETLARARFGDAESVGRRLSDEGDEAAGPLIVGVVADSRHEWVDEEPLPAEYGSLRQRPVARATLLVRTARETTDAVAVLREAIWKIDPEQPIQRVTSLTELLRQSRPLTLRRFYLDLVGAFGLVATLLTLAGVYGIVARGVSNRTREIGVRRALGATAGRVVGATSRETLGPVLVGVAAGVVATVVLGRWLASYLYGVPPHDPITLLTVSASIATVSLVASWLTARRAAAIEPTEALRGE